MAALFDTQIPTIETESIYRSYLRGYHKVALLEYIIEACTSSVCEFGLGE